MDFVYGVGNLGKFIGPAGLALHRVRDPRPHELFMPISLARSSIVTRT
jgi:hypothetical protein